MAFRRRFVPSPPRFRQQRASRTVPRWLAVSGDVANPLAAGALAATSIFNPSTAIASAAQVMERECTLLRLVGSVSVRPNGNIGAAVGMGIVKKSGSAAAAFGGNWDPLVPTQMGVRDWLQIHNVDIQANGLVNGILHRWEIDSRVKRRLKEEEDIELITSNAAGGDAVVVTIDIRILIVVRL